MSTIHYYVVNKNTNKAVYVDCRLHKCNEFLNAQENKEQFKIYGYSPLTDKILEEVIYYEKI